VDQGLFSGSVLIAKDGKIILCKGYGMANYEHGVPNTPQTKFRLGSITKQFTAMAIMQLQEKGLLNINDTVYKYIPDYPNGDKITIHHLLTHTAGIPNVARFPKYKKKKIKPHTSEELVARFKDEPLDFEPGEKHRYSNSGYMLLGYIIEKASGKTYEDFLKENIFAPLGMHNSGYDKAGPIIKNRASGYEWGDYDKLENASYIHMSFSAGAGALYATLGDLYLWDQALYTEKLCTKELLEKAFTSIKGYNYGYGWRIKEQDRRKLVFHPGAIDGFSNFIGRYINDRVSIILLNNIGHVSARKIAETLAPAVFGEKYELPKKHVAVNVNSVILDQYVGKYKIKNGRILPVTKENGKLIIETPRGRKVVLTPESEVDFFSVLTKISFVKDSNGKVIKLILRWVPGEFVAEKVD